MSVGYQEEYSKCQYRSLKRPPYQSFLWSLAHGRPPRISLGNGDLSLVPSLKNTHYRIKTKHIFSIFREMFIEDIFVSSCHHGISLLTIKVCNLFQRDITPWDGSGITTKINQSINQSVANLKDK